MADNVQLNAGAGGDIAASDEIGGIQYQRVKVVWGADGIASDTTAVNPLPVSLSGVQFIFSTPTATVGSQQISGSVVATLSGENFIFATLSGTNFIIATDSGSGKTLKVASISLSATGTVVPAVASRRIKVYASKFVCSAALSVNWRDGGSLNLEGAQAYAINGGAAETVNPPAFLFQTTAGNSLDMVITGVGSVGGRVSYFDDDAT